MNKIAEQIKNLFPAGTYGAPCSEEEIAEAENLLGCRFPKDLHEIYLSFNGLEVFGQSYKFFPLLERHAPHTTLVGVNLFLRGEPWTSGVNNIIFFGISLGTYTFGVETAPPHRIVEYSTDLDRPRVVANTILEAFERNEEEFG